MIAKTMEDQPAPPAAKHHAVFFKQSSWLMTATILGGFASMGVHLLLKSKALTPAQYGAFVTLLMLVSCVPALPLQMVFAQQTASALATDRQRQLAAMLRLSWVWISVIWLVGAAITLSFQGTIVQRWSLSGPMALWFTLIAVLGSLWFPIFTGALQGRQDFFSYGWAVILNGTFRIAVSAWLVLALHKGETGMMAGVAAGVGAVVVIGLWQMRDILLMPGERFDGKAILAQVVPLMLGFGATQFLFTSDMMFAKSHFTEEEMACYGLAGTLSRALLWLVLPLAAVMFPKIVHSTAKAEKTNLLGVVMLGTAILTICGGIGLSVLGKWVVKIVSQASYVDTTSRLLPWYAAAMVPLALANVLVNDLLARFCFRVVPPIVALAIIYGLTLKFLLNRFPGRLELPLQTLAVFTLLLFGVCAFFARTFKSPGQKI
jgi:O-antigen/teichoic acid export membrane protein